MFNLAQPPEVPGIYMLRSKPTNLYYIGQAQCLRIRFKSWQTSLEGNRANLPKVFKDALENYPGDTWSFAIVQTLQKGSHAELDHLEGEAIDRVWGALVRQGKEHQFLNGQRTAKAYPRKQLTTITSEGKSVTYFEAAKLVGRTMGAIYQRLNTLRAQGRFEVTVDDLRSENTAQHSPHTVITDNGAALTYAEAAERIGCDVQVLRQRAHTLRQRGVYEVSVDQILKAGIKCTRRV